MSYLQKRELQSSVVSQSNVLTTSVEGSSAVSVNIASPAGEFGFYPTIKGAVGRTFENKISSAVAGSGNYGTNVFMQVVSGTGLMYISQRYIQASPPYDLGDGEVGGFIFGVVDSLGKIETLLLAQDPPWGLNGPTNIRGKKPLDKNADMSLIPHPFLNNNLAGKTVVLFDPMNHALHKRLDDMRENRESPLDLFHDGKIGFGNEELNRGRSPGVMSVSFNLK